ncbi:MAG: M28 family peptidase [Candidatus Saccharicenans sp.]
MRSKKWGKRARAILISLLLVSSVSCGHKKQVAEITADELLRHIRLLSDDVYEGRGLGSHGIEMAADYQENYFRQFGLQPFLPEGYRQKFKLIGVSPDLSASMEIIPPKSVRGKGSFVPVMLEDFVVKSEREDCPPEVEAELVYAGYLIQAPERNWDDLKGQDVKGKVLLVEINEPGNYPGGIFDGEDMTYYGRWVYKFEKATELGAAGILIIHNDRGATYGWSVVRNSWAKESFFLPEKTRKLYFQGWVTQSLANKIFELAGLDRQKLLAEAETPDFRPIATGLKVKVRQQPSFREVQAENVVAWLRSLRPEAKNKYVIISAHYDHLGRDPNLAGDQIYNGAVDNCAATACLLALAGYYSQFQGDLPVNLVFAAVTAEEQNLLGSSYLASHLPVPNSSILANLNFEMTNVWGETEDVYAIGASHSDLDDVCREAAQKIGLRYTPERGGNYGFFFRSDQLSFARQGIPAVWLHEGIVARGPDPDKVRRKEEEYQQKFYHQVTDEVQSDWDLRGALQILRWAEAIIDLLGQQEKLPQFKTTSSFRRPVDLPAR